ncbi:MAG TPA: hypothetical protein VFE53_07200 [Mucilaginibacter sp.]|jgi:hypothetical protein|nr:hypothetical protein [Mucilaginibacter sp.]
MSKNRFTYFTFSVVIFFLALTSACQKDPAVRSPDKSGTSINADSTVVSSPGDFLAAKGTLKVKFNDSVYTFDATRDSIAFINVNGDDQSRYFGITAINKEHSVSFGISSAGFAFSNINRGVAGSQLLLSTDAQSPALQLSLSRNYSNNNFGNLNLEQYKTGNELAKGTFYTFMAADSKASSPYYRVEGSFDLQLK